MPPGDYPWRVRLICCGLDMGVQVFTTWEAANAFRESFCTGPGVGDPQRGGHDRTAILEANSE